MKNSFSLEEVYAITQINDTEWGKKQKPVSIKELMTFGFVFLGYYANFFN